MAWHGIKIASHRSRVVYPAGLARTSLVLAIAREDLRHAAMAARPISQGDSLP